MKERKNKFNWSEEENRCFGCGDNPWGLGLDFDVRDKEVISTTKLDANYQGFKDAAHGGVVATIIDEAAAWAVGAETGYLAPSFSLNCKFLQPVPLGEKIWIYGKVKGIRHGIVESTAWIEDGSGEVLARGQVKAKILKDSVEID